MQLNLVLEFELRKAQETIKALRGSLTEVAGKVHFVIKFSFGFVALH